MNTAGMSALSVAAPATIRRNDHWRVHYPEMVAAAEEHALARLWSRSGDGGAFETAMTPFTGDPFKGSSVRHVIDGEGASIELHAQAIAGLLECWPGSLDDFDFAVVCSMRPDSIAVGDASWLARRVGLNCPAINLETACSSALMAFDLACSLVETGRASRVLVTVACTYTRDVPTSSSLSWFLGDGAGGLSACGWEAQEDRRARGQP